MNVLSLFDGMSCGRLALERAAIPVENYYSSEIDKWAIKVADNNWPQDTPSRLGDVTKWKEWDIDFKSIDLVIAGSPCQSFSISGSNKGFEDERGKLFYVFIDILNKVKKERGSVEYLTENVRLTKDNLEVFNSYLGEPILIDSALVSAQTRKRYYWSSWEVGQPEDKNISLSDVLDLPEESFSVYKRNRPDKPKKNNLKSGCLHGTANAGGNHSAMDVVAFCEDIPLTPSGKQIDIHSNLLVRRYSVEECEMLQTLPVGYTEGVSPSQRHKMIINGWTVDVVAHILKSYPGRTK